MTINYLDYFANLSNIPHFYMIRSIEAKLLSSYIDRSHGPFLDLGCGDGTFGKSLELKDIYGIDIDEKTINKIANNGYYSKVLFASALDIPFPDGFFQTIFSNCAIEHMDGVDKVLKEVRRVLKVTGKFIFTVPTTRFLSAVKEDEVLSEIGLNTDASLDGYNKFHNHVNIFDLEGWKKRLKDGGLKILKYDYYLPDTIGRFIVRMDVLYTVEIPGSKKLLRKLEKRYRSFKGLPFRMQFNKYLKNPHNGERGTHLIIKAVKV